MTVPEYFEVVKAHLLTNPLVENFQIVRERIAANDGHIRVRMKLINGNLIEFSEYIQLHAGNIQVITYSYHCTDTSGKLIVRWDNTPHFPDLDKFSASQTYRLSRNGRIRLSDEYIQGVG
ncbi:MAG: hypothetical protein HC887_11675 [Desulfobacteraceae bacterium]|nr:hypothetical protein [Desulfobacteraceae bacterium]